MLRDDAIRDSEFYDITDSFDCFQADPEPPAQPSPPANAPRRALIAQLARERELRRSERTRVAESAHQLRVELEARLEEVRASLELNRLERSERAPHHSLFLATILSTRELLARHGERYDRAQPRVDDHLYDLESQADALRLAATRLRRR